MISPTPNSTAFALTHALTYEALLEFTSEYIPEMTSKLEHYTGRQPIFDLFDVENEIQRALERKVELKSGGYLIIDQTEAMTTVDINTGALCRSSQSGRHHFQYQY